MSDMISLTSDEIEVLYRALSEEGADQYLISRRWTSVGGVQRDLAYAEAPTTNTEHCLTDVDHLYA